MLIEICGGIASGKTTLCSIIGQYSFVQVHENYELNPFLNDFYTAPAMFAFETEVTFILQHYSLIKKNVMNGDFCCDFSLVQDGAYADLNLLDNRHHLFEGIESDFRTEIGFPDLLIYISCPAHILLKRVKSRNRLVEKDITIEYLEALNHTIENRVLHNRDNIKILQIDSHEFDFRTSLSELDELESFLSKHSSK